MTLPRRRFLHLAARAAALPALPRIAWAQTYPTRPVHLIVGTVAGATPDIDARIIGQWLSERLGQPFVIENRPGAGGIVAAQVAASAPGDGYTLLMTGNNTAIAAALFKSLPYNVRLDFHRRFFRPACCDAGRFAAALG